MQILDFYKQVLTGLRYQFNDEGLISIGTPSGKSTPALVHKKRLVLPTKKFMRDGFGEDYQPFHPLSESIARRGTSPVMQHMQRNAKAQLAHAFVYLAEQLLKVAADSTVHKDLPPDCGEFLKKLSNANDKTVDALDQLVRAATKHNKLITLYLKNGGKYDGKAVNRMTVIRFPIIEALDGDSDDVLGVDIRGKHRKTLSALFRMIAPFGDSPEEYSAGSNNRTAPYLHSFLHAYRKTAVQFNKIISRYAQPLELAIPLFDLYSEQSLEKFTDLYDQLPSLAGNEGGVDEVDEEAVIVPATKVNRSGPTDVYQAMEQQPQAERQPQAAAKPSPARLQAAEDDKTISMAELMQRMNPQQPIPQAQPVYNTGYTAQPQQQMYNQFGQPIMNQPGPLAHLTAMLGGGQPPQQQQQNPYAAAVGAHHQAQQPVNTGFNNWNGGGGIL